MARDSSLALRLGDSGVSTKPSPSRVFVQQPVDLGESLVDRVPSSALRSSRMGRTAASAAWGEPFDVGAEVPQVGVAEDVSSPVIFGCRDLGIEQAPGPPAIWWRSRSSRALRSSSEFVHVGEEQLIGDGSVE